MTNPDLLMKANTASNAAMEALPGVDDLNDMERGRLFDGIGALIVTALEPARTDLPGDDERATIRTTFTVTVLHEADTFDQRLTALNMDLKDVLDWMDDGDAIGMVSKGRVEVLGAGEIRDALLDVGNDGTFFEALDDIGEPKGKLLVVVELDRENAVVGGKASDFIGRFETVDIASSFLSLSATIDPDRLNAGHYGICEMEPGDFCDDEPVNIFGRVPGKQRATVIRQLSDARGPAGPLYEVRYEDGTVNSAFGAEMEPVATELPEGINI